MRPASRPLHIEVLGISPRNKGALLMLEAIRQQFAQAWPGARFAVPFDWPAGQRLEQGLYCTYPRDRGSHDKSRLFDYLPSGFRAGVGFWAPRDVDVVLDASGFGYGDYWGLRKLQRRLVAVARHWKTDKRTLVVMPQAMGPFEGVGMGRAFGTVLARADLVYVRDKTSMEHLRRIGTVPANVHAAPDFTCLLHAALPSRLDNLRGAVLLIPNEKMVGQDPARREAYLEFLRLSALRLSGLGRRLCLLVHEADGDRALARDLNALLATPVEVVDESSPLVTKAIIATAHVTVSSRFHGLVSALSSAVPSLACGWTHKYRELMDDYGCPDWNVDLNDRAGWNTALDALVHAASDEPTRARLARAAQQQRERSQRMWGEVFELLRRRHSDCGAHA